MIKWCSEPDCQRQAFFRDSRGRIKQDDEHDLCERHYRAKANADRAKRIIKEQEDA